MRFTMTKTGGGPEFDDGFAELEAGEAVSLACIAFSVGVKDVI